MELQMPQIHGVLPFDVQNHFQAKSAIAKSMLQRLTVDMEDYATSQNTGSMPRLIFLLPLEKIRSELKTKNRYNLLDLVFSYDLSNGVALLVHVASTRIRLYNIIRNQRKAYQL
jgi:hypothetical protein